MILYFSLQQQSFVFRLVLINYTCNSAAQLVRKYSHIARISRMKLPTTAVKVNLTYIQKYPLQACLQDCSIEVGNLEN